MYHLAEKGNIDFDEGKVSLSREKYCLLTSKKY